MTLSPDDLAETTDAARAYLSARVQAPLVDDPAASFATALVSVAARCVVGMPCDRHGGEVHGQEAEEIRAGVEQILGNTEAVSDDDAPHVLQKMRSSLGFLLDRVDARDSVGALREAAGDAEKWQGMQRQLTSLRKTLGNVAFPEVYASEQQKQIPTLLVLLIVELAGMLASVDGLMRELLREKGVACE